jgi:hypothetical protein
MAGRRLSTPVVLAIASGMISIGVVAVLATRSGDEVEAEVPTSPREIPVDTRTPEAAAETFLDAWRKREHAICRELAVHQALDAVVLREAQDAALSDEEREVKARVWDTMATSRLGLQIAESENAADGSIILRGAAVGDFLGRDYEREVEFTMVRVGEDWKVARMGLGDILSDVPDFLDVPGETYDPSEFETPEEDVP